MYESTDDHLNIKLLVGDILHCTIESIGHTFDSIWDCNALVAISPSDRERYVATLAALLKPNGCILLSTYDYDPTLRDGAPYPLAHDTLVKLFESHGEFKCLETFDCPRLSKAFELTWATRSIYCMEKQ